MHKTDMLWLMVKTSLINIRNIRKTAKGDYYATRCLLDYSCFKENYKMIPIDLTKQQVIVAGPTASQQIDFTANLHRAGNTTMFFVTEEAKKPC